MKWISVKDRLPECGIEVLVWRKGTDVGCDYLTTHGEDAFGNDILKWDVFEDEKFTHWMPLPEPPK